jgi:hypothetical protein
LRYLSILGPGLVAKIKNGKFDAERWVAAQKTTAMLDFDALLDSLAGQFHFYKETFDCWTDDDFRGDVDVFGQKPSRGAHIVRLLLGGHAAYRTQLFCYLKSCGCANLSTWNLWAGVDAPAK